MCTKNSTWHISGMQQNVAVTRMWRSCQVHLHKKNVRSVQIIGRKRGCSCNLLIGVALNVRFKQTRCVKDSPAKWYQQAIVKWSLSKLVPTVWSFAHFLLRLVDCNKILLWSRHEGHAKCNVHHAISAIPCKRGCCCNLSISAAL